MQKYQQAVFTDIALNVNELPPHARPANPDDFICEPYDIVCHPEPAAVLVSVPTGELSRAAPKSWDFNRLLRSAHHHKCLPNVRDNEKARAWWETWTRIKEHIYNHPVLFEAPTWPRSIPLAAQAAGPTQVSDARTHTAALRVCMCTFSSISLPRIPIAIGLDRGSGERPGPAAGGFVS